VYGWSTAEGISVFKTSKFNVAELGAMSRDTPLMAKVLVKRMLSDSKVLPEHWKVKIFMNKTIELNLNSGFESQLITFLIGPNDFCLDICYQDNPEDLVKNHEKHLLSVFRTLRDNLPRTMVNLIVTPGKIILYFLN
jgi:hypothetical protein